MATQTSDTQATKALRLAQKKLAMLVENGLLLSREKNRDVLLKHILTGSRDIAHCAAVTLFLKTERNTLVFAMRTHEDALPALDLPLYHADGSANERFVVTYAAVHNQTVIIDDVYQESRFDLAATRAFSEQSGFRTVSMLTVPLAPREDEVIGVLQLLNALDDESGQIIAFPHELIGFIQAMASQSAVALENQTLLAAQNTLIESLIKIVAGAIDAKSAYTGGHCERVPELAFMLAQAATDCKHGSLADFAFKSEEQWHEFRVGAWLHDCGKVTTPEYVVDKATKLETIYNRIHEVRLRFELLLRDAIIECLHAKAQGVEAALAEQQLARRKQQLMDDFAFVAECNIGTELMPEQNLARLQRIGAQSWLRYFDNRLGLSQEESRRLAHCPPSTLPASELLLADKPEHIVPRQSGAALDPKYQFKVKVPTYQYHYGELYNLGIARGTLNDEERFKINEHIIQTIAMLDKLPFPKNLKRVPEYAGTHHETMIGTGYPRQLRAEQLSVPARIMVIADIFEALTASDRPYKKAKSLAESVAILAQFRDRQHIDAELFELFLTSGVYRRYGERYLQAEQIDAVDISQYLRRPATPV